MTHFSIKAETLGSKTFREDYGIKYAYVVGSMYKGIASKELVVKMGKAGMIGFLGTGGLQMNMMEEAIAYIQSELIENQAYGMNLLCHFDSPEKEEDMVTLFLKYGIKNVEASAFMQITPTLVRFRLKGIYRDETGKVTVPHRVIAKVSRPEVAEAFMSPAPEKMVNKLLTEGKISEQEANLSRQIPMAHDICVEADSGGHTDQGVAYVLMPAMRRLRDDMMKTYNYEKSIRIGAAGGIGTPESAAAAFIMGADFILTGSINQCTVEAGTSNRVKDLLQEANVQDTAYAPAGDMFEIGAKIQVLKKGLFFPVRANKLYELYRQYNSLDEIDEKTKKQIRERYFKRSFEDVWEETKSYYLKARPVEIEKAEHNPKHKMALIFKWYFIHTTRLAMSGSEVQRVDYQIHAGPAIGAFNQWVKGTRLEDWRNRHVDEIGTKLIQETAGLLEKQFNTFLQTANIDNE